MPIPARELALLVQRARQLQPPSPVLDQSRTPPRPPLKPPPPSPPRQPIVGTLTLRPKPQPAPTEANPQPHSLDQVKALEQRLAEHWPAIFRAAPPVAMKLRIHHDILSSMPDVNPRLLSWALQRFVRRPDYQDLVMTAGSPRCDLQGIQTGVVTNEEVERLLEQRRRHAEKLANRFTQRQQQERNAASARCDAR